MKVKFIYVNDDDVGDDDDNDYDNDEGDYNDYDGKFRYQNRNIYKYRKLFFFQLLKVL